jgi:hypothetical protein
LQKHNHGKVVSGEKEGREEEFRREEILNDERQIAMCYE